MADLYESDLDRRAALAVSPMPPAEPQAAANRPFSMDDFNALSQQYGPDSDWRTQQGPNYQPQLPSMEALPQDDLRSGVTGALQYVGEAIPYAGRKAVGEFARGLHGGDAADVVNRDQGVLDSMIGWSDKAQAPDKSKYDQDSWLVKSTQDAMESAGGSLANLPYQAAGAAVGSKGGAALGSLAGPGGTVVGGLAGGFLGATAGAAIPMKRAEEMRYMEDMRDRLIADAAAQGRTLTNDELVAKLSDPRVQELAGKSGLAEAGFESLNEPFKFGMAGFGGKALAKALPGPWKIPALFVGNMATSLMGETATDMVQRPAYEEGARILGLSSAPAEGQAYADKPITEQAWQSFKAVAPATMVLETLMGGVFGSVGKVRNYLGNREQRANNNDWMGTVKEAVDTGDIRNLPDEGFAKVYDHNLSILNEADKAGLAQPEYLDTTMALDQEWKRRQSVESPAAPDYALQDQAEQVAQQAQPDPVREMFIAAGVADKPEWQQAEAAFNAITGDQSKVAQARNIPIPEKDLQPGGGGDGDDGGGGSSPGVQADTALAPALNAAFYEPAQVDAAYQRQLDEAKAAGAAPFPQTMDGANTLQPGAQPPVDPFSREPAGMDEAKGYRLPTDMPDLAAELTPQQQEQAPAPKVLTRQEQRQADDYTKRIDNLNKRLRIEKNVPARMKIEETIRRYSFELNDLTGQNAPVLTPEEQARSLIVSSGGNPQAQALPPGGQDFGLVGQPQNFSQAEAATMEPFAQEAQAAEAMPAGMTAEDSQALDRSQLKSELDLIRDYQAQALADADARGNELLKYVRGRLDAKSISAHFGTSVTQDLRGRLGNWAFSSGKTNGVAFDVLEQEAKSQGLLSADESLIDVLSNVRTKNDRVNRDASRGIVNGQREVDGYAAPLGYVGGMEQLDVPVNQGPTPEVAGLQPVNSDGTLRADGEAMYRKGGASAVSPPRGGEAEGRYVYRNYDYGNGTPFSEFGHAMWANNPGRVSHYGKTAWKMDASSLPSIEDLRSKVSDKYNQALSSGNLPQSLEEIGPDILNDLNPKDIVEHAGVWDNPEFIQWFGENVAIPDELMGVRTNDGAISFDGSSFERSDVEPLYRQGGQTDAPGLQVEDVKQAIKGTPNQNIIVLASPADIPNGRLRLSLQRTGNSGVKGVYDAKAGKSYVFASNAYSMDDIIETANGETIHRGTYVRANELSRRYGGDVQRAFDELNAFHNQVLAVRRKDVNAWLESHGYAELINTPKGANEWLAHDASKIAPKWYDRFVAAMLKFFRRAGKTIGFDFGLTDAEIRDWTRKTAEAGARDWPIVEQDGRKLFEASEASAADGRVSAVGATSSKKEEATRMWQEQGIESPYFKEWFGSSKVVGDDGKPMAVYHGTRTDFEEFKNPDSFRGFYFTKNPAYAGWKTSINNGKIIPVYLKIENPFIIDGDRNDPSTKMSFALRDADVERLKSEGYDGIINKTRDEIVAFDSNQIKSVFNRGTFSSDDNSIMYRKATPQATSSQPVPAFDDPAMEARYREATKGIADQRGITEKVKEWFGEQKAGFTRHFIHLPNTPEFSEAHEALRQLEAAPTVAKEVAVRNLKKVTGNLSPGAYDLFTRKVILDDLIHEATLGHSLPYGFTPATLAKEKAKIDRAADNTAEVKAALDQRKTIMDDLAGRLVKAGILSADQVKNPAYFRHEVLEYAREWQQSQGSGGALKKPKPGYAKGREGSEKDISANYLEVEYAFQQRALVDLKTSETLEKIKSRYDQKPALEVAAKESNARALAAMGVPAKGMTEAKKREALGAKYKAWTDIIPEGYERFQADKGLVYHTGNGITDKAMLSLMDALQMDEKSFQAQASEVVLEVLDGIRKQITVGGKKPEMVLPKGMVDTLNNLRPKQEKSFFDQALSKPLGLWKQWVLINPRRVLKYNLNNMAGDIDAVIAGNPKALKRMPEAIRELRAVMKGGEPSKEYMDAVERGVFDSGLSVQEIPDIARLDAFQNLMAEKSGKNNPMTWIGKGWRGLQDYTQFRENWLRLAAYKDYLTRINAGEDMKSIGYGAADPKMVDALSDPRDKAALLARSLVGDYGAVSHYGQGLRNKVIPFYSWMEVNAKRYNQLIMNAFDQGIGQGLKAGGLTATMLGARASVYLGVRMAAMYMLIGAYNHLFHGDDEEKLSELDRQQLHVILGHDKDGNIHTLKLQGALSDFLGWFGYSDAVSAIKQVQNGRGSYSDVLTAMAKAPVNKIAGGLTPFLKTPLELAMGQSLFPDVFNPRPIQDKAKATARLFSLENEYDAAMSKPTRGYWKSWAQAVDYSRNVGELSYNSTTDLVRDFKESKGIEGAGSSSSPKSRVIREYKLAQRYGDDDAAKKALAKMQAEGITPDDMEKSLLRSAPLAGIARKDRAEFMARLSPKEQDQIKSAEAWYKDTFLDGDMLKSKYDFHEMQADYNVLHKQERELTKAGQYAAATKLKVENNLHRKGNLIANVDRLKDQRKKAAESRLPADEKARRVSNFDARIKEAMDKAMSVVGN